MEKCEFCRRELRADGTCHWTDCQSNFLVCPECGHTKSAITIGNDCDCNAYYG